MHQYRDSHHFLQESEGIKIYPGDIAIYIYFQPAIFFMSAQK